MKTTLLTLFSCLTALVMQAQVPTNSFAVTSACPANAGNPSVLQKINTDGSLTPVGTITDGIFPLIINGLGYNVDNQTVLYGMSVQQPVTVFNFSTPPTLYQIALGTASATSLGQVVPPPKPSSNGFFDIPYAITFNFIGDGDRASNYYVGGVTLHYNFFFNTVSDVKLYVGVISLTPPISTTPQWRLLDTSEPGTAAVIASYSAQVQAYLTGGGAGPAPDGGIQDWVYVPSSGNLVSYLGVEDKFLTIANPGSAPVATTISVATPIPNSATRPRQNIGAMFTDRFENVYAVDADGGTIFKINKTTGDYSGQSYGAAFGCSRGDAVSFAGALPLPVTLTSFTAQSKPNSVLLNWTTASEKNVEAFRVERSADGVSWNTIASVPATNTTRATSYSALDNAPLPGRSYYHLAVRDLDGSIAYSPAREVSYASGIAQISDVYPNPAHNGFVVQLSSRTTAPGIIQIINSTGQLVWKQSMPRGTASLKLSQIELPAGLYYVRIDGQKQVKKLMITN